MLAVAVKEAKNQLSKYLQKVRNGEVVLITDRGRVVAQLAPPPLMLGESGEDVLVALRRLSRAGVVQLATGEIKSATADLGIELPEGLDAGDLLDEVRADR